MRIERRYTKAGQDAYAAIEFRKTVSEIKTMLARRGLMHLKKMPKGIYFDQARQFLYDLSRPHRTIIREISWKGMLLPTPS